MKTYHIKTVTGSLYTIKENTKGQLRVSMAKVVLNPFVNPANRLHGWQNCEINPWPLELGKSMYVVRPEIPWGQGQVTQTSPIIEIKVEYGRQNAAN